MHEFEKDYKLNPRIRELIEQRKGSKTGMSHNQIEILINDVYDGKNKGGHKYTSEDKTKIMFHLGEFSPNGHDKEEIGYLAEFLKNTFDNKEVKDFVTKIINRSYHPGMVAYNIRISNSHICYFMSLFSNLLTIYKGIIINTTFIGDVKKVYPSVIYDENTGEITDGSVKEEVDKFVNVLKNKYGRNLKVFKKDDIVVLASKKESVIDDFNSIGLNVEEVPEFYFEC